VGNSDVATRSEVSEPERGDRYKWVALTNVTLGILLSTIDGSITLIAMPDIFRGIHLDPLGPGNSFYLLWMLLGFLIVSSVLVVNFGRLGDLFGRVRFYNLGFVIYTFFSLLLTVTWMTGRAGAMYLIVMRIFQGVGAAFIIANSAAILTDAFPPNQRGMALGINNVAGISGTFIGLVLGGVLAPINWRLVFLVSVPFGLFGTVWAYLKLEDRSMRGHGRIDWLGNLTFAVGLVVLMIGITYGIQPADGSTMGWTSPKVLTEISVGVAMLALFAIIERHVPDPMFRLRLFRIRAFTAGSLSTLLSGIARGGLQFMLIIWLQGIWLPEHGYSFSRTPLWAGIYMLPLTFGFLIAGPISGILSDRFGSRPFATGGMLLSALSFGLLELLPINFPFQIFALLLFMNGASMGLFASPNRAGVMNSLPPQHRGAGGGMNSTFQNSAQVISIGVFFSLMIVGLSSTLPHALLSGLMGQGVPKSVATVVSKLPPVSVLFAAFLGYNPIKTLLGSSVLDKLSPSHAALLTGRRFFPSLISGPFSTGLHEAFDFAIGACLIAAAASALRGGRYVYRDQAASGTATGSIPSGAADDATPVVPPAPAGAPAGGAPPGSGALAAVVAVAGNGGGAGPAREGTGEGAAQPAPAGDAPPGERAAPVTGEATASPRRGAHRAVRLPRS
jgi:MFS family permease